MNILGIYSEDYPWDIRIEKILGGLAECGHTVDLVCRNLAQANSVEQVSGITCRRVLKPSIGRPWQSLLSVPAFFNPVWQRAIRRAITETQPDLVFVRDLPLASLAISEAHRAGLPCLVDMAENHPEMWKQVCLNDPLKIPSYVMKNPSLAKRLEIHVARNSDFIFVVVDEMREHLLRLGAEPSRVVVISNTPDLANVQGIEHIPESQDGGEFLDLIYTGFVTNRRGIDQVIHALSALADMKPLPRLHIVGMGDHLSSLNSLAKKLGIENQLICHGWVDHAQLSKFISDCHFGIVPHPKTGHTDTTIPNKIFDYMAMGKPVLVSNALPLERIVTDLDCGLVFTDGNVSELADRIRMFANFERRLSMGKNGLAAIQTQYNWAIDFQRVIDIIGSDMLKGRQRPFREHDKNN